MNQLTYRQFIDGLNEGRIIKAVFQVENYNHYRYCTIERKKGYSDFYFDLFLTKDRSEHMIFCTKFGENHRIFDFGRKGKYTLEYLWDRIKFIEIVYA